MTEFDMDLERASLMSRLLQQRGDIVTRKLIEQYDDLTSFAPLEDFGVSDTAWNYVESLSIEPRLVFAHPNVLREHPTTSLYYRGMTMLSLKQVARRAVQGGMGDRMSQRNS